MLKLRSVPRFSFKTYCLLLCCFYFLLLYMFHSKLRGPGVRDMTAEEENDVNRDGNIQQLNWEGVDGPGRRIIPGKVFLKDEANKIVGDFHPKNIQPKNTQRPTVKKEKFKYEEAIKEKEIWNSNCYGDPPKAKDTFQQVAEGMFMYSAYYDNRHNDFDNKENGTYMRIMTLSKSHYKPNIKCYYDTEQGSLETPVSYYEMCENHGLRYGGYILSCRVPKEIVSKGVPCSLKVALDIQHMISLPVESTILQEKRDKFAVCVSPLFGDIDKGKFLEWVEQTKLFGADRITLYDYKIPSNIQHIISYYNQKGDTLHRVPWTLPSQVGTNIWYNGQLIAIMDCLYRHMGKVDYVAFYDLDEFMVPHTHNTWSELINHMHKPDHCGYQFNSAFFDPNKQKPLSKNSNHSGLYFANTNQRTVTLSKVRTKCMMQPHRVFEAGIHHISKPILAHLQVVRPEEDIAILHHYRNCLGNYGMTCNNFKEDSALTKYVEPLQKALNALPKF